jgi:hypothetical protein
MKKSPFIIAAFLFSIISTLSNATVAVLEFSRDPGEIMKAVIQGSVVTLTGRNGDYVQVKNLKLHISARAGQNAPLVIANGDIESVAYEICSNRGLNLLKIRLKRDLFDDFSHNPLPVYIPIVSSSLDVNRMETSKLPKNSYSVLDTIDCTSADTKVIKAQIELK